MGCRGVHGMYPFEPLFLPPGPEFRVDTVSPRPGVTSVLIFPLSLSWRVPLTTFLVPFVQGSRVSHVLCTAFSTDRDTLTDSGVETSTRSTGSIRSTGSLSVHSSLAEDRAYLLPPFVNDW